MLDPFIAVNDRSIYFYPGVDDFGRVVAKLDFVDKTIDYKYVKYEDKSIEYVLQDPDIKEIDIVLTDVLRHKVTKKTLIL